jgi:PPOX class F420-dependent enzyme/OxyR family protein
MSAFTPAELECLRSQRLGRIVTANANGQPHVVPVSFRYNAEHDAIEIGGHGGFAKRKKYRDVQQNPRAAFVVDDMVSVQPQGNDRTARAEGGLLPLRLGGRQRKRHSAPREAASPRVSCPRAFGCRDRGRVGGRDAVVMPR